MRFTEGIDLYIADMYAQGRMTSAKSERSYRDPLLLHAEDCQYRDPTQTTRDDVKRTLRRWPNPNTQANRRSVYVSFYDWLMEEGYRRDNPARQTRRPRKRKPSIYRMTEAEVRQFLAAARTPVERRVAFLGVCAGLRAQELQGMQGRHFAREGFVWVSTDVAKGHRERWVPVIDDLAGVAAEIRREVEDDEYAIEVTRVACMANDVTRVTTSNTQPSYQVIYRIVGQLTTRAGIAANITPHTMRHAFADHIARQAGMREAQAVLGHASIGTTQGYVGAPTLDELTEAVAGVSILNGQGGHV